MSNDPLLKHIEELEQGSCEHRKQFINFLEKGYERLKLDQYSQANPKPLSTAGALKSPLKRVVFEIEALLHKLLHGQEHAELCVWMLYVSRHKIENVSNDGKLTPDKHQPWDGFDALIQCKYVMNWDPDMDAALQHDHVRSWRCFSEFFMEPTGSFVMQLKGGMPGDWKILRSGALEESSQFECGESNKQENLNEAIYAFAKSAWGKFEQVAVAGTLYIIGVGSHDKKWPFENEKLEAIGENGSDGDSVNSVFLVFSLGDNSEATLIKIGSLLSVIDDSLRRALLAELHDSVKREAERLDELTSVLTKAEQKSERITLESLLMQAADQIKDCVKLSGGCVGSERVLWDIGGELEANQEVEIACEDLEKEYVLTEEDKRIWGNKRYKFFFAEHAFISVLSDTKNKAAHKAQTLRIVYVLMLRMRTRRAGLRNAVSAIMGRNMSHNIGSHVLARYSSAIKYDLDPANKEKTDHRTDFLSYLQRRMDFLAEVATSDSAHWAQPLSLREALSKLNYKTQADRIAIAKKCEEHCARAPEAPCTLKCALLPPSPEGEKKNEPILLSYITGKESLKASVEFGVPAWSQGNVSGQKAGYIVGGKTQSDFLFSCPGGEVGVQALYVILENIIRNSARHATGDIDDDVVNVFVSIEEFKANKNGGEELIKLTIIDPRTKLDPPVNGETQTEICELDAEGHRIKKESLTAEINSILQCEPFLNADGSTNPHYWGVREMQICAHYLRGYPLSDLESMKYDPAVIEAKAYPDPAMSSDSELPGYCLSYEIYVQRAKLLAVVNYSGKVDCEKKELEQKGIKFIEVNGLCSKEDPVSLSGDTRPRNLWHELGDQVHGFSFLALPPNCKFDQRNGLPVRTQSLDEGALGSVLDKACRNEEWMEPLHELVTSSYRGTDGDKKNSRWGEGKIHAVVGWESGDENVATVEISNLISFHHVKLDSGKPQTKPFGQFPNDELPIIEESHPNLGVAWLDHSNNKDLLEIDGAAPAAAAIFVTESPNWACVEPMFSDSPHMQLLKKLRVPSALGAAELVAAALARVVVLDERIQSRRADMVRSVSLHVYWPLAGIWCPFHPKDVIKENGVATDGGRTIENIMYHPSNACCDLDRPDFEVIQRFLTKPSKLEYQLPADFLVIHLTILENLNKQRNEKKDQGETRESLDQTLCKLVEGTACKSAEKIIVTGRGVPTAARHVGENRVDARYLPISALQEYLVTRPSKLALMRALWSAAAPRHDMDDISGG